MNKPLIKNISFFVGVGLVFFAGILYILLADIVINTQSIWLMLAVLFALGSAVCTILSERYKGRNDIVCALKGVGVGLSVCFMGILLMVMLISFSPAREVPDGVKVSAFVESFSIKRVELRGETGKYLKDGFKTMTVYLVSILVAFLGMVGQILDLVMTATTKEE